MQSSALRAPALAWQFVALIVVLPALLVGCVALVGSGVAVAATSYLSNGLSRSFPADPDSVWLACQEALRLEGYFVRQLGSRERENNRSLCFTTSAYEMVPRETRVWLEVGAPGFTRVHVRVGMFETADSIRDAERVLARVEEELRARG